MQVTMQMVALVCPFCPWVVCSFLSCRRGSGRGRERGAESYSLGEHELEGVISKDENTAICQLKVKLIVYKQTPS